jgi:ribosomal protein S18 acetylase RimI-like enzyme
MKPDSLVIQTADLHNPVDAAEYRTQLAAYASDPMGGAVQIPAHRLDRVIKDLREMPHARLFLARRADTAIGFASCFSAYSTFRARPLWNIHDIAVLREQRGKGVGKALINHIAEVALHEGCCKLTLEVRDDNPVAKALYRKRGFTSAQVQDRQVQYLFLEKTLAPA